MDWTHMASIAAGISGVFGLLGFVVYATMYITSGYSSRRYLTPEMIGVLKDSGIDTDAAREMKPKQLEIMLKSHGAVTTELVKTVNEEMRNQGRVVLVVSICFVGLCLVLGILAVVFSGSHKPAPSTVGSFLVSFIVTLNGHLPPPGRLLISGKEVGEAFILDEVPDPTKVVSIPREGIYDFLYTRLEIRRPTQFAASDQKIELADYKTQVHVHVTADPVPVPFSDQHRVRRITHDRTRADAVSSGASHD